MTSNKKSTRRWTTFACFIAALLLARNAVWSANPKPAAQPVVLSARFENGVVAYRLNGKRVEDTVQNSLLTNLSRLVSSRGTNVPVFVIIDVRAPFSEVGKLETALDKSDLTKRRLFVTNFEGGIMNEIHWDERPLPLPHIY